MKRLLPALLGILSFALPFVVTAEVPQQLNYQGRVSVQGVNFNGTGQFKFALVDAPVNQNQTATASAFATLSVTSISVESGGSGYTAPPAVVIAPPDQPGGVQATAAATITGGVVTAINIIEAGSGYSNHPQVTIAPPPVNLQSTIYWSNAGDLAPGQVPGVSVAVPVTNGLYSVALGDTSVPNMAPFYSNVLSTRLFLRVWFDDGVHGFQQLTPDQPLGSAPYALHARLAETVPPGSISGFQLADGSVSSLKMGVGAALANLQASGQSGVPSGAMVLSANANDPNLTGTGYLPAGVFRTAGEWQARSEVNAPSVRLYHSAIWTGTELVVWGGGAAAFGGPFSLNDGGRYNPITNVWTPTSMVGAPWGRFFHAAVWTGTEMIVWGGFGPQGGRYNPITDTWAPMPALPGAGSNWFNAGQHRAIWTGVEMIVVGGGTGNPDFECYRFNPSTNLWTNTSDLGKPTKRYNPYVAWTGSELIVWGGFSGAPQDVYFGDGARYNPLTDTWTPIPLYPAIAGYLGSAVVWTGNEMIVWGGVIGNENAPPSGASFIPTTSTWTPLPTSGAPTGRRTQTAVWTGSRMLVWGGDFTPGDSVAGGSYDPIAHRWTALPTLNQPLPNRERTATWTGEEMLIFGGSNPSGAVGALSSFRPGVTQFLYRRP